MEAAAIASASVSSKSGTLVYHRVVLEGLPLHRYRASLAFRDPLDVPPTHRGILFRGAFGITFRRLVCHDLTLDCAQCPLRGVCAYPAVFAPLAPEGTPARLREPPRPFVLGSVAPDHARVDAGTVTELRFCLVGRAQRAFPHFVVTLQRLGSDGIGRTRARFEVGDIRHLSDGSEAEEIVFDARKRTVSTGAMPVTASSLLRPGDGSARRARVTFVTPTDLREGGRQAAWPPSFGTLIRRARDRAGALATFFGDGPLADAAKMREVGARADAVTVVDAQLHRVRATRRSARTGERHPIEGVCGWVEYEGEEIAAAMPWLRVAEVVHVGKHATFGAGEIGVQVVGRDE